MNKKLKTGYDPGFWKEKYVINRSADIMTPFRDAWLVVIYPQVMNGNCAWYVLRK